MTEKEYNEAKGIRRSDLWKMEDSPEKFKYFLEHPEEQTAAMAFGSACHKMILEPETFGDEYAIAPQCDRRTKEGKAMWNAFAEDNEGKTIVGFDDAQAMADMETALEECPLAYQILRTMKGTAETPFFWTDPDTGEDCKIKLDRLGEWDDGKLVVVDYKTATSAETNRFCHDVFKLGYHMQAAMYTEGVQIALGLDYRPQFIFVVQEKKAPYAVNVIEVSDDVMRAGTAKFHELLQKYSECKAVDIWPGYVSDIPNETILPGWYMAGDEE